jgi:hypothetical protein
MRPSTWIFIGLAALSVAVLLLSIAGLKRRLAASAFGLLLGLAGAGYSGYYFVYAAGYYKCVAKPAPCPAPIGGNGYICTNELSPCAQGSGENEDKRCRTVAGSHFWESPCECKCI